MILIQSKPCESVNFLYLIFVALVNFISVFQLKLFKNRKPKSMLKISKKQTDVAQWTRRMRNSVNYGNIIFFIFASDGVV